MRSTWRCRPSAARPRPRRRLPTTRVVRAGRRTRDGWPGWWWSWPQVLLQMWHECAEGERPVRDVVLLVGVELRQGAFGALRLVGWKEDRVVAEAVRPARCTRDRAGEAPELGGGPPVGQHERRR